MRLISEFREFAIRGNVIDLAVGVIIGGAFGGITTSLVNDILMPPLGYIIGGVDFSDLTIVLRQAAEGQPAVTLKYGNFIQVLVNFVIIAFAGFLLVKGINSLYKKPTVPATPPPPPAEAKLLTEIRDLLAKN